MHAAAPDMYEMPTETGKRPQTQGGAAMNKITLIIPGSIRSKKNSKRVFSCGRFTRVLPSKAYEEWEKQAHAHAWYHKPKIIASGEIHVEAHFFYAGPRPDLSGCLESVGDCLEGIVWANDRQIVSWDGSRLHHDKDNPRTEITVRW